MPSMIVPTRPIRICGTPFVNFHIPMINPVRPNHHQPQSTISHDWMKTINHCSPSSTVITHAVPISRFSLFKCISLSRRMRYLEAGSIRGGDHCRGGCHRWDITSWSGSLTSWDHCSGSSSLVSTNRAMLHQTLMRLQEIPSILIRDMEVLSETRISTSVFRIFTHRGRLKSTINHRLSGLKKTSYLCQPNQLLDLHHKPSVYNL